MNTTKWDPALLEDEDFLVRMQLLKVKSIAVNGDKISLTWDELNDSDTPYKRSLRNGTGATPEIEHLQKSLNSYIQNYLCIKISKDQICYIVIDRIDFKEKGNSKEARIKLTLVVNNSRDINVTIPWTPLYDFDRDSESNEYCKPFPPRETEVLNKLELEVKYYIEGKRGPEQQTLFSKGSK